MTPLIRRTVQLGFLLLALLASSLAGDVAYLRNGFAIRHDRREIVGDKTRLFMGSGYLDVASSDIERIEHDDMPAPTPVFAATPVPSPGPVAPAKTIDEHLRAASSSSGIDRDFLESVIHYESGFNPKAISPKGARGLMQLMPDTANRLGVKDSFDPAQNILGGTAYLKQLLELYHGDAQKALAAYNAGPLRVEQYKGIPPYRETQLYVAGIIREYNRKKMAQQTAAKLAKSNAAKSHSNAGTAHRAPAKPKGASVQTTSNPRPTQPES